MAERLLPWEWRMGTYVTSKLQRMGTRRSIDDVTAICKRLIRGEAVNGYCDCDACNTEVKTFDPTVDLIHDILKESGYLKETG